MGRALLPANSRYSEMCLSCRSQSHAPTRRSLQELEDRLRQGGGAKKIEKQHRDGKLTARERIARLLDPGAMFLKSSVDSNAPRLHSGRTHPQRLDREATRKHGQPPKNSLPFLAERIHAPVERRLQRALPGSDTWPAPDTMLGSLLRAVRRLRRRTWSIEMRWLARASGMPSACWQIRAIANALPSLMSNPGRAARARWMSSCTASKLRKSSRVCRRFSSGVAIDGTRQVISPPTPSTPRLVARMRRPIS